jgi:UDP-N-acetylmuramoyl-L-alanyl-D-glutamate--2,6-diaminopimelate ligase
MDLGELIDGLGVRLSKGAEAIRICDITEDSRTVVPGSLFIARGGLKADGKQHIGSAIAAGAVAVMTDSKDVGEWGVPVLYCADVMHACAVMAERFYGSPSQKLNLALVTGTNGKTTITTLIWRILNGIERRCGLIGTVLVDDGAEVARASMTTPPSIEISRSLQMMVDAGCMGAAIEASSHALDQKRVDALKIEVAVFTNLSGDHLDYHKTMEAYLAAKARCSRYSRQTAPRSSTRTTRPLKWRSRRLRNGRTCVCFAVARAAGRHRRASAALRSWTCRSTE